MLDIDKTEVYGWEAAIRGLRNPLNSWDRSDTQYYDHGGTFRVPRIGSNDYSLMKKLAKAGSDHGKFLRMITVTCDINAPLYWWKEYDTYKVGTVANSCSTMHKIHSRPLTLHDFSHEWLEPEAKDVLLCVIETLNTYREFYCDNHNKDDWYTMIQLLPTSYNQLRTVQLNYQVLKNMYFSRRNHKLDEWRTFCEWIENLPYSELITGEVGGEQ